MRGDFSAVSPTMATSWRVRESLKWPPFVASREQQGGAGDLIYPGSSRVREVDPIVSISVPVIMSSCIHGNILIILDFFSRS